MTINSVVGLNYIRFSIYPDLLTKLYSGKMNDSLEECRDGRMLNEENLVCNGIKGCMIPPDIHHQHNKNSHASQCEGLEEENSDVTQESSNWEDEMKPPDGGWGWVVAFGGFLIMVSVKLGFGSTHLQVVVFFSAGEFHSDFIVIRQVSL